VVEAVVAKAKLVGNHVTVTAGAEKSTRLNGADPAFMSAVNVAAENDAPMLVMASVPVVDTDHGQSVDVAKTSVPMLSVSAAVVVA